MNAPHSLHRSPKLLRGLAMPLSIAVAVCSCVAEPLPADEHVDTTLMTFDEFESMTYREPDTGIYIVDGDTPILTREELQQFFVDHVQGDQALAIHRVNGVDAAWSSAQKRSLTYCVSTSFGTNYTLVVDAMKRAANAWESAADIDFIHLSAQDSNCTASNTNVVFDVRPVSGAPYLARAFFPNYSRSSRNVLIDSSAFSTTSYSLRGILRHELGHTLGFRHEHTRPEAATCFEDSSWRALTPYDKSSVMHYPQCNGISVGDLFLSTQDRTGAASVYGLGKGNLALMANTSASTTYCSGTGLHCYSSDRVNDDDQNTTVGGYYSWSNSSTSLPQWVELNFGHPQSFNRIELYTSSGYAIRNYQIQYWTGSTWATAVTVTGNTSVHRSHTFSTKQASKVRVLGQQGPSNQPGYVRVNELEVYMDACVPSSCQSWQCGYVSNGCGGTMYCGACSACGNGICESNEDSVTCPADCCGPVPFKGQDGVKILPCPI